MHKFMVLGKSLSQVISVQVVIETMLLYVYSSLRVAVSRMFSGRF